MARTKPSVAEAAAARREADAALEAARRQHLAALEIAAAAGQVPETPHAATAPMLPTGLPIQAPTG